MSYLLIGAMFLGIGAQASTVREVQTLSMPVTMARWCCSASPRVGGRQAAQHRGDRRRGLPALLALRDDRPGGRAAGLWPHLAGAGLAGSVGRPDPQHGRPLFRRSVLKSGKQPPLVAAMLRLASAA